jgi:pilus assembly protein Flp/PilA
LVSIPLAAPFPDTAFGGTPSFLLAGCIRAELFRGIRNYCVNKQLAESHSWEDNNQRIAFPNQKEVLPIIDLLAESSRQMSHIDVAKLFILNIIGGWEQIRMRVAVALLNLTELIHGTPVWASPCVGEISPQEDRMKALFNRFIREDSGQDLIEYGLLIGLITALVVTTITNIGIKVQSFYTTLCTAIGCWSVKEGDEIPLPRVCRRFASGGGAVVCVRCLVRLVRDQSGQDLVEYGLLAGAVAAIGVALFPAIATAIGVAFRQWNTNVNNLWVPPSP